MSTTLLHRFPYLGTVIRDFVHTFINDVLADFAHGHSGTALQFSRNPA